MINLFKTALRLRIAQRIWVEPEPPGNRHGRIWSWVLCLILCCMLCTIIRSRVQFNRVFLTPTQKSTLEKIAFLTPKQIAFLTPICTLEKIQSKKIAFLTPTPITLRLPALPCLINRVTPLAGPPWTPKTITFCKYMSRLL